MEVLENLSKRSKTIGEDKNKQVNDILGYSEDITLVDDFYDKYDVAFHVEEALNYVLNKFSKNTQLIQSSQEDKEIFIKEYICEVLGEEYTQEDYEYDLENYEYYESEFEYDYDE